MSAPAATRCDAGNEHLVGLRDLPESRVHLSEERNRLLASRMAREVLRLDREKSW